MKKIKITEENIRFVVKETIKKIIAENAKIEDLDKLDEYMWLKTSVTHLSVDLFADDCGAYKRYGHDLLLYARNGYGKNIEEFIPFSISMSPIVLDDDIEFNISYNEIFEIMDFIQLNCNLLFKLSEGKISQINFLENLKTVPAYSIRENRTFLNEMSTLKAVDSGLPVDIWLDEGATFKRHAPRIKFRASNDQRTTIDFSSMIISDEPSIENMPENSPIRKKDIDKLKDFVLKNKDLLLRLANGEIDYATEFLPNVVID